MKVVLNVITNFEGESLKPGDIKDVPLKIYQRWINRGIAHKYEEFTAELKTGEAITKPLEEVEVKVGEIGELVEVIKKPKYKRKKSKWKKPA